MPLRIGPGPVFVVEFITAARRWQMFAQRSVLVLLLLAVLSYVLMSEVPLGTTRHVSLADYANLAQKFSEAVLTTQLVFILLGVPVAIALAVCSDNARGKLELMLVTDLSSTEIVLGILLAQLFPVFGLIFASLPVLFITGQMGGVSWEVLLCSFVTLIGAGIVSATLALAVAIGSAKTRNAIWNAFFVFFHCYLFFPILHRFCLPVWVADWVILNPFALIRPLATRLGNYGHPIWHLHGCVPLRINRAGRSG